MKTVEVTFPDGTVRDCPARVRIIPDRQIPPGPPRIELVPIDNDEWEFYPVIGGWRARRRR